MKKLIFIALLLCLAAGCSGITHDSSHVFYVGRVKSIEVIHGPKSKTLIETSCEVSILLDGIHKTEIGRALYVYVRDDKLYIHPEPPFLQFVEVRSAAGLIENGGCVKSYNIKRFYR